ncbi:RelA/SpoT family protein [Nitrosococcus halophilus Nc 4]|uniref:GTP pyrophosphokinase n=1 Tax=Nitrosococcus halophilus (strain Nc4) TaxID=472759 RepID=D5C0B5_NITHN|nr:bifunctional (p)ppGpp synthetase/guanosine-3',5'-bis(diphosphate) 3'-pyrophosphohydrolase [Nitrosococcus halophilus]ADE14441.1 RelA/SpoT family protein [Nitrosococcus halophilus Nc 4]
MVSTQHNFKHLPLPSASELEEARALLTSQAPEKQVASLLAQGNAVAELLAELGVDTETQSAGLLLPAMEMGVLNPAVITKELGPAITRLLRGAERLAVLKHYRSSEKDPTQAEKLRKMLLAIVEDPRVVLVRLADHLYRLRHAKNALEATRQTLGQETLDIFAPLANRLGIWQLKWELEDLALRYLEPETYQQLARALDERRIDRERYIAKIKAQLKDALTQAGLRGEVSGRPKHLYSIWKKMRNKNLDFHQLFDVHAFRVIVDDVSACYATLSLVHTLWTPIPEEFDDYIANPKPNGYRSLHTAVLGPGKKPMEIQIRSFQMHGESELGVASHWRYKEGAALDTAFEQRIAWLRSFLDRKEGSSDNTDLIEQFKSKAFHDRIYVLTPQGRVIDLPEGSTPLDFAYAIHTEVGHRCRGAKVDGAMVALTQPLASGQKVEILTTREGTPSRDWLNPRLGYLHTASARTKIQRWFKQRDHDLHVARGRTLLERERQRVKLAEVDLAPLLKRFRHPRPDSLLAALGRGDISLGQLNTALREQRPEAPPPTPEQSARPAPSATAENAVHVLGVSNLLSRLARCCSPIPGDPIIGYITQGGGVAIHRRDCPNITKLSPERRDRLVDVAWHSQQGETHSMDISIQAEDRKGLLHDITSLLAQKDVNILTINTLSDRSSGQAHMRLTIEVSDTGQLNGLLKRLTRIPGVMEARRSDPGK